MADNMKLQFKMGNYSGLADAAKSAGTIYITKDEKSMYVDISNDERIKISGNFIYCESLQAFNNTIKPPYSQDVVYFIAAGVSNNTQYSDILTRWNGEKWVILNTSYSDFEILKNTVEEIQEILGANDNNLSNLIEIVEGHAATLDVITPIVNTLNDYVGAPAEGQTGTIFEMLVNQSERIQANVADIDELQEAVGDENSGLIKDVADHAATIENELLPLVDKVGDLETAVGSPTDATTANTIFGQLNKHSEEIGVLDTDLEELELIVGDESKGLVQKVNSNTAAIATKAEQQDVTNLTTRVKNLEDTYVTQEVYNVFKADVEDNFEAVDNRLGQAETAIGELSDSLTSNVNEINAKIGAKTDTTTKENFNDSSLYARTNYNKAAIESLEADLEDKLAEIEETFKDSVRAADAMVLKGSIANESELNSKIVNSTENSIGDTYVVTNNFSVAKADGTTYYHAGDLVVVTGGTEDTETGYVTSGLEFTIVDTGYQAIHAPALTLEENNSIKLSNFDNDDLGTVTIKSDNLTITSNNSEMKINMEWGTF